VRAVSDLTLDKLILPERGDIARPGDLQPTAFI
jgi:hypothetical protein